ncbi:amino acid ABC transporter substrate-binding protein [Propionigenium maris DSM 9537]|uniref:Amino acid ABC transporter substrate-binding protein n=1 Tax=Propionigenium maris DSM 9537 TaxID=1123000 RepID=A0A9W6GPU1_9FUSO|nr:transporter substrate-binding domain-containing protein [Propionigenium maris]GLI58255.1 amino acid ABC transporter substrate-binding protein [Propionigenium maris DSM 9537]
MKKIFVILLTLSVFLTALADREEFVVGMELEFPPFETIDNQGNPSGVSVELSRLLSEELGQDLRIENISYSGLIPALLSGKIDAIISSMGINESRARKVDFSDPYAFSPLVLLAYKDSSVKSPEDLNNSDVKIAVRTGTIGYLWAAKNAHKAEVKLFDKESQAVMEVAQGKVDVFIYDPQSVVRRHKKYPDTTRVIMDPLPGVGGWGVAVQKGNTQLLEKINNFIQRAKGDGTFDEIREKYLKEEAKVFEEETGLNYFF